MFKATLRRKYKHMRDNMSEEARLRAENIVYQKVIESEEFISCDTLFAFASRGSEISTINIIQKAFEMGKNVAVPLVTGKHDMCFIYISSLEELKEGKFGIRTENELICRKGEKNEYGQFMYFENLTYVPIDLDAIDPNQMTDREKGYLNAYHARVYELVSPFLNDEEAQWLKKYTRAI